MTDITTALAAPDPSTRLRAALRAGTGPDPALADLLVARCAVEDDFFVRDMLTWALTRLPPSVTMPRLVEALASPVPRARAQALQTLSKIGDRTVWPQVAAARLLDDPDDEVARTAWRTAVTLVPPGEEAALAAALGARLGRGDAEVRRSLSRALLALGEEAARPVVDSARRSPSDVVRDHAEATARLLDEPDGDRGPELAAARRAAAIGRGPIPGTA